ncbi:hypothetical protein AX16_003120 [Volvariella volvacea WC 439]|nr:hypothetical protein AX16_003120 [Volvariella volvacea WC 439]
MPSRSKSAANSKRSGKYVYDDYTVKGGRGKGKGRYEDVSSYTTGSDSWYESEDETYSERSSTDGSVSWFTNATETMAAERSDFDSSYGSVYYSSPGRRSESSSWATQRGRNSSKGISSKSNSESGRTPRREYSSISRTHDTTSATSFPSPVVLTPAGKGRSHFSSASSTGSSTVQVTNMTHTGRRSFSSGSPTSTGYTTASGYQSHDDGSGKRGRRGPRSHSNRREHYPPPSGSGGIWTQFSTDIIAAMASARDFMVPGYTRSAKHSRRKGKLNSQGWQNGVGLGYDVCYDSACSNTTMSSFISDASSNEAAVSSDDGSVSTTGAGEPAARGKHARVSHRRRQSHTLTPTTPEIPPSTSSRQVDSDADSTIMDESFYSDEATSSEYVSSFGRSGVFPGSRFYNW